MTLRGADDLQARLNALRSGGQHRKMLGQIGLLAVQEAKDLVPRKTGNLGRTIRLGTVTERSVQVKAGGDRNVGYAAAVEFGTKAHDIVPVRAKALAWGGARRLSGSLRSGSAPTFFAKRVRHPGTRAQPYLIPGAKKAMSKAGLRDAVVKVWNDAA